MKTSNLLYLLASIVLFNSCKKDSPRDPYPLNGNYIDKIYSLWDDGTGMDTMAILTVNYDNLKRVVSMSDNFSEDWKYVYSGNDMKPSKATIGSYGSLPDTFFYSYNSDGLKTKDSVRTYNSPSDPQRVLVEEYSYQPGRIITITREIVTDPDMNFVKMDTATLDASGNITQNRSSRFSGNPLSYLNSINSSFTYDNRPHPFSAMNIFNSNRNLPFGETFALEMFTPNNRLTQIEIETGSTGSDYQVNYSYEYNADGFPTKIITNHFGETEITLITYKSL